MIYQPEFREKAKVLIRQAIAERPMSKDELLRLAREHQLDLATRAIHEAAWSMAEDGEAFWNDQWLLELTKEAV